MHIPDWLLTDRFFAIIRCILVLCIGLPLIHIISRSIGDMVKKYFTDQSAMVARNGIFYSGLMLLIMVEMHQMGFQITALLGAAGIAGVAIGFAAQTSLSNIISGIFLISEQPFAVGDVIKIGETTGIVLSIDLLSVKLRLFDNKFVRIPNENIIKGEVTNITRFPIRRYDINMGVAYKEDIVRVMKILKEVANKNPYCLDEPEPTFIFLNFGNSALEFLFAVWFVKTDFVKLRNTLMPEIKRRFDEENIEIPFPHQSLYVGAATKPFPISIVPLEGGDQDINPKVESV